MTTVTTTAKELRKFIEKHARTCVHKGEGLLPHPFVTPTYDIAAGADDQSLVPERSLTGHYLQMYDWDACFFSQAAHRIDQEELPLHVVENFLALKQEDGYVPRTISPKRIWDAGDQAKPFLCQTLLAYVERKAGRETSLTAALLGGLTAYLEYFIQKRADQTGLFRWRNVLESGVDDNLAMLAPHEAAKDENAGTVFPDNRLLCVDLNSYLVMEFSAMAKLLKKVGDNAASKWEERAKLLTVAIEEKLWCPELHMYCNLDPQDNKHVHIKSWTGLLPAIFGMAQPVRSQTVIDANILSPEQFLRPCGLASMAASEPLYNQAKRGLYGRAIVSNWQGPMWILPNALAARGLVAQKYHKYAEDIAARVVKTMAAGLDKTGTLFENYNAETGETLWAPQFMSWNLLTLELIELLG